MGNCDAEIDYEVNRVIDQILREDRLESMGLNPCLDLCEASSEEIAEEPQKNCAIETSARFSIRILEALRAVQRKKATSTRSSSTMGEIVRYIRRHYNYDGDLCSQVETALDQVTEQGFVLKTGVNGYHLMGPFACSVPKPPTHSGCNQIRLACERPRSSRGCSRRRRSCCTPNANSTFTASDCPAPFSLHRLSTVSGIDVPEPAERQNRSNRERSVFREDDGRPFNGVQDNSMFEEIYPPVQRPGCIHGGERIAGDHDFDENEEEDLHPPIPHEGIRRPGGGGRRRVIRDHVVDENVQEIPPLVPNEPIQRFGDYEDRDSSDENVAEIEYPFPGGLLQGPGGRGPVNEEHSSDENMYCDAPAMNGGGRRPNCQDPGRRRRRDSSSSRSSVDSIFSRHPSRRSRINNCDSSSDADISDDADVDDSDGERPWVRNCKNRDRRMLSRRGRRCSSGIRN